MADVLISQIVQRYSKNLGIIKLDLPPWLWGAIRKAFYLLKALIVWNWLRSKRVSRWYPDRPHISLGNSLLSITVTRRHHYMPQLSLIFFPLPLIPLLLSCQVCCRVTAAGFLWLLLVHFLGTWFTVERWTHVAAFTQGHNRSFAFFLLYKFCRAITCQSHSTPVHVPAVQFSCRETQCTLLYTLGISIHTHQESISSSLPPYFLLFQFQSCSHIP